MDGLNCDIYLFSDSQYLPQCACSPYVKLLASLSNKTQIGPASIPGTYQC